MRSPALAALAFAAALIQHLGFAAVDLASSGSPGYATAALALAAGAALAAIAVRHGWDDHPALLAWALAAAAAIVAVRWAVAELGQPIDATSPLSALLPAGHGLLAWAAWGLWRDFADRRKERLRMLRAGAAVLLVANGGFTVMAFVAGGLGTPFGLPLAAATGSAALLALAANLALAEPGPDDVRASLGPRAGPTRRSAMDK